MKNQCAGCQANNHDGIYCTKERYEDCIRVHPYGLNDNIPICPKGNCACILLPGEEVCPHHLEASNK